MKTKIDASCSNCKKIVKKYSWYIPECTFCSNECKRNFTSILTKKASCIQCNKEVDINFYAKPTKCLCIDCKDNRKFNKCFIETCSNDVENPSSKRSICNNCFDKIKIKSYDEIKQLDNIKITKLFCKTCNIFLNRKDIIRGEFFNCKECARNKQVAGGIKSANSQNKRSKNEIMFADLCIKYFDNVLTNNLFFKDKNNNYWDADIILPNESLAIHWNGNWHYKDVYKNHSLIQVQSRDKIKLKVIADNNFESYIIADLRFL